MMSFEKYCLRKFRRNGQYAKRRPLFIAIISQKKASKSNQERNGELETSGYSLNDTLQNGECNQIEKYCWKNCYDKKPVNIVSKVKTP